LFIFYVPSNSGRSYSVSGFEFQHDLLPLTASLSDPETVHGEGVEKNIGLVNGELLFLRGLTKHDTK
jgi:hypothetical protein